MSNLFRRLNIAAIIPEELSKSFIKISRETANKNEVYFILDGHRFLPHMTIYSPEFPEHIISKVFKMVGEISAQTNPINAVFLHPGSEEGFIDMRIKPSDEINALHKKIVNSLNNLRENRIRDKYTQDKAAFSEERMNNIYQFGYPEVMSLYKPHITITRLKDEKDAVEASEKIKLQAREFLIEKIGIFEMGDHGTCTKLVKEFSLKQL